MSRSIGFGALLSLCSLLLVGCLMPPANGPRPGAVATGEPLAVVDDMKVWTTTSKQKVAETEYKDEDGRVVATGSVYADKTELHAMRIWYPMQGSSRLADEDFFRITGDQASLQRTEDMRARGATWRRRGLIGLVAGAVGMLASNFVDNSTAKLVLLGGGFVSMGGGYYAAWWGAQQMDPDNHAVDRSVADEAARAYNAGLGRTVSIGVSRSF